MTRTIPLLFLIFFASFAFTQPRVGGERQIASVPFGVGFSEQTVADLAFHDGRGFVIWNDSRSAPRTTVLGSRIDERGELLDPQGIRLADDARDSTFGTAVVWMDGAWTAIWQTRSTIAARRIAADGRPLTPPVVLFAPPSTYIFGGGVTVASNGRNLMFAHSSVGDDGLFLTSPDLATVREVVTPGGSVIDVSSDGEGYLVRAYPPGQPRPEGTDFVRLSAAGDVMATREEKVKTSRVVWTGRDHLLFRHVYGGQLVAQRLSKTLEAVGEPFPVSPVTQQVNKIVAQSSALDGTATIAWVVAAGPHTDGSVFVSTVGVTDSVSTATEILPSAYWPATLAIAHDRSDAIVAWTSITPPHVHASLRLQRLADLTIETAAAARPRVMAFGGQRRLAASRTGNREWLIYEQVRSTGVPEVHVATRSTPARAIVPDEGPQITPAIAAGDSGALAVWLQGGATHFRIVAMPIGEDGAPLREQPSIVAESTVSLQRWVYQIRENDTTPWFTRPSVIWTGSHYLVAFPGFVTSSAGIRLARVGADGSVLDPGGRDGFPLQRTGEQMMPLLAKAGSTALLAWVEGSNFGLCQMACSEPVIVRAGRLTLDGEPIDTEGLDLGAAEFSQAPDLATNGDVALLTWLSPYGESFAHVIDEHGVRGPTFEIKRESVLAPSVTAHGDSFLLAYRELRDFVPSRILGHIISRTGEVSAPFPILDADHGALEWVTWTTPDGRAAIGYRRTGDDTDNTPRLFLRELDSESRRRAIRR